MKNNFEIIAFDADDTLWINQPNYDLIENEFCDLLSDFMNKEELSKILYSIEMKNIGLYGYGAKSFTLSMIETALGICDSTKSKDVLIRIIQLGKELITVKVELINGVLETLDYFKNIDSKIILITKGDLIDQEQKLSNSNLQNYFHHIEILSNKTREQYNQLLSQLEVKPYKFLMIGNSMHSDIKPVLDIGGYAVHVPYHTTWIHEEDESIENHSKLIKVRNIREIISLFQ